MCIYIYIYASWKDITLIRQVMTKPLAGCCEQGNELPGPVMCGKCVE